ncbi:hypothetical protein [Aureimonas jatrophae]|uniref:Uncharacterized protein n=1 Tax=Aureimonas jatrophae TaxID=1166073 RepID=A0A1H0ID69_9HYPH|nr:hypothetical protein [Aureimonas jatrophae]MBB3952090.1 hypothetical protein [Aureimonas jatrophae]SDO29021.1 hypothetical protein SAMN05192530_10565 [Aureimonas jatrophae]
MVSNARRAAHSHRPVLTIEGEARLISRRPLPRREPFVPPFETASGGTPTPEWGAAIHAAERAERERRSRRRTQRLWTGLGLQTSVAVGALAALLSVASHSSPVEASYDPITAIIQEDALR